MRFILGHVGYLRSKRPAVSDGPRTCACGCGGNTTVHRGIARIYVHGHNAQVRRITEEDWTIEDRGYETACWIWKHSPVSHGGGQVTIRGKKTVAYRAMYEQEIGPIPAGKVLHHLCEQRMCIRPSHVEVTTQSEHIRLHGIPGWNRRH